MRLKKFFVLWHEINDSGVPQHVMGHSPVFDTEDEAKTWLESTIKEDRARFAEDKHNDRGFEFSKLDNSDNVWVGIGGTQTCYYSIEHFMVKDRAADCVAELKELLKPTAIDGKPINCEERIKSALIHIGEHENEWLPLRKWSVEVDICSGGASCTQFVMARTADEARQIVNQRIDGGCLELTDDEKADIVNELLRNTCAINANGPVEELS